LVSPQRGRRQNCFPEEEILIAEGDKGSSFETGLTQLSLTNV
jgi:hypothetical protein